MNLNFGTVAGAAACALLLSINAHGVPGEAGTIDATWGGAGQVKTPIGLNGNADPLVVGTALQADRKLVVAASCEGAESNASLRNVCLVRYLPDGTLDASFGSGGILHQSWFASASDYAVAVLVQSDQKLIVVANCGSFCYARLNSNGSFDTTYGTSGTGIERPLNTSMTATHAEHHPDGRLSIVGHCTNGRMCAMRINSDGIIDGSFGTLGRAFHDITAGPDSAHHVVAERDGAITMAGRCNGLACVVRLDGFGALDTSFSLTGYKLAACGTTEFATKIRRQPDGKYLIGGAVNTAGVFSVCVTRLNADGTVDTGFASGGIYAANFSTNSSTQFGDIHLQPDGRIIVVGSCYGPTSVCARRLNGDGSQDPSFANVNGGTLQFGGGATLHSFPTLLVPLPNGNFNLVNSCEASAISFRQVCSFGFEGGAQAYRHCTLDLDGDGRVLPGTDALMLTRIAAGFKGDKITNGVSFAAHATRTDATSIHAYLVEQCGFKL